MQAKVKNVTWPVRNNTKLLNNLKQVKRNFLMELSATLSCYSTDCKIPSCSCIQLLQKVDVIKNMIEFIGAELKRSDRPMYDEYI